MIGDESLKPADVGWLLYLGAIVPTVVNEIFIGVEDHRRSKNSSVLTREHDGTFKFKRKDFEKPRELERRNRFARNVGLVVGAVTGICGALVSQLSGV